MMHSSVLIIIIVATYAKFYMQTTQVPKALLALGVNSGDRVGIGAPKSYEWALLHYATARLGNHW